MSIQSFRESTTLLERQKRSNLLLIKYKETVPVILEKSKTDKILQSIEKTKYIIPLKTTVGDILQIIRKQMNINDSVSIYIMVGDNNKIMLCGSQSINQIYKEHKNDDGFLYLEYCGENVFG